MKLVVYLCILSFPYFYCATITSNLKLVQLYFRHGSRAPGREELYPNYVLEDNYIKDMEYKQLTQIGKRLMYDLGLRLKDRYQDFLQTDNPNEISYTKTTNVVRTKVSALLVLAGLFPPKVSERFDSTLNWTPLPYHYEKFEHDYEFGLPYFICPAYKKEYIRLTSSEEVQQYIQSHKDTFEYVQNYTGKALTTVQDLHNISQGLSALKAMNADLPKWTARVYPQPMQNIALQYLRYNNYNTILKRFNGGTAMQRVVENMVAHASNSSQNLKRKIYINSVHDTNVAALMGILNILDRSPNFGSTLLFELHVANDKYIVKVFYFEYPYSEFEEILLPECGINCPLETFINITAPYISSDVKKECSL